MNLCSCTIKWISKCLRRWVRSLKIPNWCKLLMMQNMISFWQTLGLVEGCLWLTVLGLKLVLDVRWTVQGEGHHAIAPSLLSYVPIPGTELTDKMTFPQRFKNFLYSFFTCFQFWYNTDQNYIPFVYYYCENDVHYMELFQATDTGLGLVQTLQALAYRTGGFCPELWRTWRHCYDIGNLGGKISWGHHWEHCCCFAQLQQ